MLKKQFNPEELHEIQLGLEANMFGSGIERFEKNNQRAIEQGAASETAWFRRLTKAFIEPFSEAILAYLSYYEGRAGRASMSLTYLKMLPAETSAYVAIKVIFDSLPQSNVSAQMIAEKIGRRLEDQVRFTRLESCAPKYVTAIKDGLKRAKSQNYDHAHRVMAHAEGKLADDTKGAYLNDVRRWAEWPKTDMVQLGSRLIDIFTDNVLYNDNPVVTKEVRNIGTGKHKSVAYLVPTEAVVEWVEEFKDAVGQLSPCYAPCVIQPRDWKAPTQGGYHSLEVASKLPLVKANNWKLVKRLSQKQMPVVYSAVNALQAVKWTISSEVLAVADSVAESDYQLAMPSREPLRASPVPIPADLQHLRGQELKSAMTEAQWDKFSEWKSESAEIYDKERERRGKFVEAIRTIAQAKVYNNYPNLHFVYTLDFRGRVYCQSSLVSPQGGDLQKGLLKFAHGKKLGKKGYFWLAVQGANVWGEDKCSFEDRVSFIENMTEEVKDYAIAPTTFKGWASADKPWQFLNWCFEWNKLQEWIQEGNSPEDFISHIPVAMDGSCSGIQHYSAMLRDPIGGKSVNLIPSGKPEDIYGDVAKVTITKLSAILEDDEETRVRKDLATAWLNVGVTRGGTKKSVMTLPYGSTQLTCRESVGDYLKEMEEKEYKRAKAESRDVKLVHPFNKEKDNPMSCFEAEKFLSKLIWDSISEVVVAARVGMSFIKEITKHVAKANKSLEWITPTGFIVEQAIYKTEASRVKTQLMGETFFTLLTPTDMIDTRKMGSSCAPNFIHSYDASHLTLVTADFCQKNDLSPSYELTANGYELVALENDSVSIAVIHDSFGTHAGDTDILNLSLRECFVSMYKDNELEKLKEYSEEHILEEIETEVPEFLGLDLSVCLESEYIFA